MCVCEGVCICDLISEIFTHTKKVVLKKFSKKCVKFVFLAEFLDGCESVFCTFGPQLFLLIGGRPHE